jgi:hypothetical protein
MKFRLHHLYQGYLHCGLLHSMTVGALCVLNTQHFAVEMPLLLFTASVYWGTMEEYCISCWGQGREGGYSWEALC